MNKLKICFYIFLTSLFLALVVGTITWRVYYVKSRNELDTLMSKEGYLRSPEKENDTKNSDLERIAKQIEDEEGEKNRYYSMYFVFLVLSIATPCFVVFMHGFCESNNHEWDDCLEECPVLSKFAACCESDSSVSEDVPNITANYERAPEALFFRRTRNRVESVGQVSSPDLPSVPSTSND